MDVSGLIINFILKYLLLPWNSADVLLVFSTVFLVGVVVLICLLISVDKAKDFFNTCKKLRLFIYACCALIIPCFGILLPVYLYIPAIVLSLIEINKKERTELSKLGEKYELQYHQYNSEKSNPIVQLLIIIISSLLILLIMILLGFHYSVFPVMPMM